MVNSVITEMIIQQVNYTLELIFNNQRSGTKYCGHNKKLLVVMPLYKFYTKVYVYIKINLVLA